MTTPLAVLIPRDVSINTRIKYEAEEPSNIRQGDVPESKNARIEWERTTSVLPLPYQSIHILSWYKDDGN